MAKRRISKASKTRLVVFGTISVFAIIYFAFSLLYNTYLIIQLSSEKKSLENKYSQLQQKAEDLKIDIEKLNDPEYLANYARENYLYSKDGEYIIQMEDEYNETTSKLDEIDEEILKQYIVIGLSVFMGIIFIYILTKGKKKKKKK